MAMRPGGGGFQPGQGTRPGGNRPGGGQLAGGGNRPGAGQLPGGGNRPGGGLPGGGGNRPGAGNGPNWANRPGAGGSGTQWAGNRPNWANRPGAGGSGTQWAGNRPDWANRPGGGGNWNDRPNWANRPGGGNWNDRPNRLVNNGNINTGNIFNQNNNITQNNLTSNRFNNFNGQPWGYNAYQSNWSNWHAGSWNNWNSFPGAWYTAGAASGLGASMLWGTGADYSYSNPFYVASPSVAAVPALDYSQPVQVPAPVSVNVDTTSYASPVADASWDASAAPAAPAAPAAAPAAAAPDEQQAPPQPAAPQVPPEATTHFDDARQAFKMEEYDRALKEVEEAIKLLPKDATLHEFRALVLFAQKKFQDAAAGIYAVLAVGPGWNWETMSGLYAKPETYTKQLRALEAYARDNPKAADARFLLAYHYLVLNSVAEAVKQLKEFEKLVPKDQLAPQLVKAFTESPDTSKPKAEAS
jgi:tetratricopeptide (TPR) repeat protein